MEGGRVMGRALIVVALLLGWAAGAQAAGPPAKLTLAPMTAQMAAGDTAPFTVTLLDAAGAETALEPDSQVGFAVDVSSVASVTIDPMNPLVGNVTARRPGTTAVRAFYVRGGQQTNIFAAADLTVTPAADGGVVSEHDAATAAPDAGAGAIDMAIAAADGGACPSICPSNQICVNGACGCAPGLTLCGPNCIDVQTDETQCGACLHRCAASERCEKGVCQYSGAKAAGCCSLVGGRGTGPSFAGALFVVAILAVVVARRRR